MSQLSKLLKLWEQSQRILTVDCAPKLRVRELVLVEAGRVELNDPVVSVRRITAIQDVTRLCKLLENLEHILCTRDGCIIIEVASIVPKFVEFDLVLSEDASRTTKQVWKGSACVREDDLAVGVVANSFVVQHVESRCGGLEGVSDDWLRQAADKIGVNRVGGMHQDDRRPTVQLGPDVLEVWVAEVMVSRPVSSEESYTVCFQSVECVGDLLQGQFLVLQVGQRSQKAVLLRVVVPELGCVLVRLASEIRRSLWVLEDTGSGSRQREDCLGNVELLVDDIVGLRTPLGDFPARGVSSGGLYSYQGC